MNSFGLHPNTRPRPSCDSRQLKEETAGLLPTPFSRQQLHRNQSKNPAVATLNCPQRRWMAEFLAMRLANGRPDRKPMLLPIERPVRHRDIAFQARGSACGGGRVVLCVID